MPFNVGPMELMVVLVLALVVLGPKRLPDAAKSLGKGINEFKESLSAGSETKEVAAKHATTNSE
jgi:sec-independent protein translocase protein TatA